MSIFLTLADHGQAIWFDYIHRASLVTGELEKLVREGIRGVTSNPTIFEKAIAGSTEYDRDIAGLAAQGKTTEEIYERLAMSDIADAADILRPVYDATAGGDGFVSFEVNPGLAHDTAATVAQALRLFRALDKPNVMIKVPATAEGIPAIEQLIGEGVNVNVTLIFSVDNYLAVADAYLRGLERRHAQGHDISRVASVASFFVSRIDTAVDALLAKQGSAGLAGTIAIANARHAFSRFHELTASERWRKLQAAGARPQRLLWASTGTKNPAYSDTMYVDELIGRDTVNTVPPATLDAFRDHGAVRDTLAEGLEAALGKLEALRALGIDLAAVTADLQRDGVASFKKSFDGLLASVETKRDRFAARALGITGSFGRVESSIHAAMRVLRDRRVPERILKRDHTVWNEKPTEIGNRLGWLDCPSAMPKAFPEIHAFTRALMSEGYTHALLLGMGGSSLAPAVFASAFAGESGHPRLALSVLDSTHPDTIEARTRGIDFGKTLFIVSTKSGGTVETMSLLAHFHSEACARLGAERAGGHFIAITDPGSGLEKTAQSLGFRRIFLNDPNIGGRFSALSHFGLVPAGLAGIDLDRLIAGVRAEADTTDTYFSAGMYLGAVLGGAANAGADKATFVLSPGIKGFGAWLEQLIAESTGKNGTGILPVAAEMPGPPHCYAEDRLFVYIRLRGDTKHDASMRALEDAGHPVMTIDLGKPTDLGREMYRWEIATAIAGHLLGLNPFDQPDVESAKVRAREILAASHANGTPPSAGHNANIDGIEVAADQPVASLEDIITWCRDRVASRTDAKRRAYVCIQAFTDETPETDKALAAFQYALRNVFKVAATVGYGPRFLHSTGQLHKGDAGNGVFIQILGGSGADVIIPDLPGGNGRSLTFGTLIRAQALGDRRALADAGRDVITLDLGAEVAPRLKKLMSALSRIVVAGTPAC